MLKSSEVTIFGTGTIWHNTVSSELLCHYPLIAADEMKRMLVREAAQESNPHRGVLFQDPFYGAL